MKHQSITEKNEVDWKMFNARRVCENISRSSLQMLPHKYQQPENVYSCNEE